MSNLKFINYNWYGTIADHCVDFTEQEYIDCGVTKLHNKNLIPENVKENDIIFVKVDYIYNGLFQSEFLPRISNKFYLITANSSYDVTKGANITSIISNKFLQKWYCTNAPQDLSDKIVPIPIGFEEKERFGGDQDIIDKCFKNKKPYSEKKDKILLPYHNVSTNSERAANVKYLSSLHHVDVQTEKLPFEDYLNLLNEYKYVICLEGAGQDLHRFYETLLVGSVPIGIKNSIEFLFKYWDLPGHFVRKWYIDQMWVDIFKKEHTFKNVENFLTIEHHTKNIKNES